MCDDDCPHCGARHVTPFESEDLTVIVEKVADLFAVFRSPNSAEHSPDYLEVAKFLQKVDASILAERLRKIAYIP